MSATGVREYRPDEQVEELVRERVHASGKTNLSRAVTELVKAGLIRRHYQGYRVDRHTCGGQRRAVCTLVGNARFWSGASRTQITGPERICLYWLNKLIFVACIYLTKSRSRHQQAVSSP
ncbi:MAG: hypothetical protein B7Z20_08990 [Sphingobium sp. 32-64-5]|nr:MAG: hypothetical protein B7Z20_08990 [Sphingobium sp. 32-64-5]